MKALFKQQRDQPAEHAAAVHFLSLLIEIADKRAEIRLVRGCDEHKQIGDIRKEDGQQQRGNKPEGHRSAAVEYQNPGGDQKGRGHKVVAPSDHPLHHAGEESDNRPFRVEKADHNDNGKEKKQNARDLAAQRRRGGRALDEGRLLRALAALGGRALLFCSFGAFSHWKNPFFDRWKNNQKMTVRMMLSTPTTQQ